MYEVLMVMFLMRIRSTGWLSGWLGSVGIAPNEAGVGGRIDAPAFESPRTLAEVVFVSWLLLRAAELRGCPEGFWGLRGSGNATAAEALPFFSFSFLILTTFFSLRGKSNFS